MDRAGVSKIDIPFQNGYKPQFSDEMFEISLKSTEEQATLLSQISKKEKFYEKRAEKMFKWKVKHFLNHIFIDQ